MSMAARLYFLAVQVPGKCRDCAFLYLTLCPLSLSLWWVVWVCGSAAQILMQLLEQLCWLIPEVHMATVSHMALSHLQLMSWEGIRTRQAWSDVSLKCPVSLLQFATQKLIESGVFVFGRAWWVSLPQICSVFSWTCVNFCHLKHHSNRELHGFSACCVENQLVCLFCHLISCHWRWNEPYSLCYWWSCSPPSYPFSAASFFKSKGLDLIRPLY